MDPLVTPLIVRGALAGVQGIAAASRNTNRPTYKVPDSQRALLSRSKTRANQTYQPGRDRADERIQASQNTGISRVQKSATNPATAINAAAGINAQAQDATLDQNAQDQQMEMDAEYQLDKALFDQARWEDRSAEWNERLKFREEANAASGLTGAAVGNVVDGVDDFASYKTWQNTYGRNRTNVSPMNSRPMTAMGNQESMAGTAGRILSPVAIRKAGMYAIGQ